MTVSTVGPALKVFAFGAGALALSACASASSPVAEAGQGRALCRTAGVTVLTGFPTAGRHHCTVTDAGALTLSVDPESALAGPINPSPWYRFDLEAQAPAHIEITLDYGEYWHRYDPLAERGGRAQALEDGRVSVTQDGRRAALALDLDTGLTRISARDAKTPAEIGDWIADLAARHSMTRSEYGRSAQDRALQALTAGPEDAEILVVAMTRQHPPEISGAQAFEAFAEALMAAGAADTARILMLPLANPDGVAAGHWRHGARGVDLNRDWFGPVQPSIAAAQARILSEAEGRDRIVFLDFHSTNRTVIYSPPDDYAGPGSDFLKRLREAYRQRLDAPPPWEGAHNPGKGTSKGWAISELGAPGLTVELADDAPQAEIAALAEATAEAVLDYARTD